MNRELIDRSKMLDMYAKIIDVSYDTAQKYPEHKGIMLHEAQTIIDVLKEYLFCEQPITEKEIIKAYLKILSDHIANFKWHDINDDFMIGVSAVCNLIDNLVELMEESENENNN